MFFHRALITSGQFHGVEIAAGDVFRERVQDGVPFVQGADDRRNRAHAGQLRRAPASFAGHDFIAFAKRAVQRANDDRLDDTQGSKGRHHRFQFRRIDGPARLVVPRDQRFDGQFPF